MCLCSLRVEVFTLIQQCIYCLPDEVDLCDVEAVPHSINCSRPFQLRHGESIAIVTEVEGNLCKQKQLKRTANKLQPGIALENIRKVLTLGLLKIIYLIVRV